jgi:hypothetical protein
LCESKKKAGTLQVFIEELIVITLPFLPALRYERPSSGIKRSNHHEKEQIGYSNAVDPSAVVSGITAQE